MSATVSRLAVPPRERDYTDSLWRLYSAAHQRALVAPNIDNMRAAIDAYDRWLAALKAEGSAA